MAETVVSFLLSQLSTLFLEEGRLSGRLGKDIQEIKAELGYMRAFLRVAETKQEDDPRLQEWIRQVREAAYDTEDVLDEFMLRFDCTRRPDGYIGAFRRIFATMKNLRARHRIASEIQQIKKRTAAIFERQQRYKFEYGITDQTSEGYDAPNNNISWQINRDEALLVEEAKLVDIDGPKRLLISQLLDSDSQLKVVSVLGMGGLGKTTLIRRVYEDAEIRREFELRAWVTVSQTVCPVEELIKDLIEQF